MRATTTVSIYRGERTEDSYGDTEDFPHAINSRVPAYVAILPSKDKETTGRAEIWLSSRTTVQCEDILKDERSGNKFRVELVSTPNLVGQDLVLDCVQLAV